MTLSDVRQERDDLRAENNALAVELADALAEVTRLRAALLKVYECDGCRHCSDLTGTALDTTSATTK